MSTNLLHQTLLQVTILAAHNVNLKKNYTHQTRLHQELPVMFARLLLVLAIDEICPAIENTSPRPPYTKTCPRNLYNCGIVPGRDCYTDYNAVEYTTTGLYDALLNCPDSYLVKISFNDGRGDMDNLRADWVKGNSQLICKNGEWRYYSMSWDRPLRHIACYR